MVYISLLQDLVNFYKVSINHSYENTLELLDKELLELSNYAFKIANNTKVSNA